MKIKSVFGTVFVFYLLMMIGVNQSATAALNYQTTLGTGSPGNGNNEFNRPHGVAVDFSGNIYVSDFNNHRVQKFDSSGTYIRTFGGIFGCTPCDNDHMNFPHDVEVDSAGNVYVADANNHAIQIFDGDDNHLLTIGTRPTAGAGANQFNQPKGLAVVSSGNIYVADFQNNRVQIFTSAGGSAIDTIGAGSPSGVTFDGPNDVAVDSVGNIYVTDQNNHRVLKFDPAGDNLLLTIGTGSAGSANNEFSDPAGIKIDSADNIYVADTSNERIQKFDSSGTYLSTLGETGVSGTDNDHFDAPIGVTLDVADNLYVGDFDNHRVQIYNAGGFASYVTINDVCEIDLASGSLAFVAGDPISNGADVGTGEISEVMTNSLGNLGSMVGVFGTDWTDGGALTVMTAGNTKVSTSSGDITTKTPLTTTLETQVPLGTIAPQTSITTYWDVQIVMAALGYSGPAVQTITVDFACV